MIKTAQKLFSQQGILILSLLLTHVLSFIFNAYLGRILSFEQFSLITLLTALIYLLGIFTNALGATINHKVSFLLGKYDHEHGQKFYEWIQPRIGKVAGITTAIFILSIPLLSIFFHVSNGIPFLLFSPTIVFGLLLGSTRGYLSGRFFFRNVGLLLTIEALLRLVSAVILVNAGMASYAYVSIPLSVSLTFLSFPISAVFY